MKLFTPIQIGNLELKNRLVMSPMTTDFAEEDLSPSQRLLDYLEPRAQGGVAAIILEACTVDRRHREVPRSLSLADDGQIAKHRRLADLVHRHDAKVFPQLAHPGPDSMSPFFEKIETVGPSVAVSAVTGVACRPLAVEEIPAVVEQFGEAARRAQAAGYDGIELHAAHAYMLLGSFLSPWRNKRSDAYGGSSVDGRLRILLETIRCIRGKTGADFPLILRISGYEGVPGGRTLDDSQRIAPILADAGVDAFHVSGGVSDRLVSQIVAGGAHADGHNVAAAQAVKQVVDVPVITVGRIHDPRFAEQILQNDRADLIAMGRPLLADPALPVKSAEGRYTEIRSCISCENCIDSMAREKLNCAINPAAGRESELRLDPAGEARTVIVIGGGPAGMEAARVAALRGHRVTLIEKQPVLGGSLRIASIVHPANEPFLDYLCTQMERLPITLEMGTEASVDSLRSRDPDVVIVATGGRLATPKITGDHRDHVLSGALLRRMFAASLTPEDHVRLPAWQSLGLRTVGAAAQRFLTPRRMRGLSRWWLPLGRRVVIVGADLAGVELAEFLAERGRRVSVLEPGSRIAPEVGRKRRAEHTDRLDELGVPVNTDVAIEEIVRDGVVVRPHRQDTRKIPADHVILTGTIEPDTELFDRLRGLAAQVHAIGDCTGLGLIRKATEDAMRISCSI